MVTKTFYVWLTCVSTAHIDKLLGRLVKRNFGVRALGNRLQIAHEDNPAVLMGIALSKDIKEDDTAFGVSGIIDEMKDCLKVLNMKYYSIVVTEPCGSTWALGNISMQAIEQESQTVKKDLN